MYVWTKLEKKNNPAVYDRISQNHINIHHTLSSVESDLTLLFAIAHAAIRKKWNKGNTQWKFNFSQAKLSKSVFKSWKSDSKIHPDSNGLSQHLASENQSRSKFNWFQISVSVLSSLLTNTGESFIDCKHVPYGIPCFEQRAIAIACTFLSFPGLSVYQNTFPTYIRNAPYHFNHAPFFFFWSFVFCFHHSNLNICQHLSLAFLTPIYRLVITDRPNFLHYSFFIPTFCFFPFIRVAMLSCNNLACKLHKTHA